MGKNIERIGVGEVSDFLTELGQTGQTADYIAEMCASLRAMATQPELHQVRILLQCAEQEARRFAA